MSKDPLLALKHIGYCWSQTPPSEDGSVSYEDFVAHAKFSLCRLTHTLMKDPIWESYTIEEILVEFYAHIFSLNKDERIQFEATLQGSNPDIYDWLDKMVEKNQEETNQKIKEMGLEDSLSFTPKSLGD